MSDSDNYVYFSRHGDLMCYVRWSGCPDYTEPQYYATLEYCGNIFWVKQTFTADDGAEEIKHQLRKLGMDVSATLESGTFI